MYIYIPKHCVAAFLMHSMSYMSCMQYGDTAVTLAASEGRSDIVDLLLKCGAHKEHENEVRHGDECAIVCLCTMCSVMLHLCTHLQQNVVCLRTFFCAQHGGTALTLAANRGHSEVVKLLLNCGASIEHENKVTRVTSARLWCVHT